MHNPEEDLMKRFAVLCLAIIGAGFANTIAKADEMLKFRMFVHAVSVQNQEVGDVDGHVLYVGRYSGLASFSDGSVGPATLTFSSDYIKGAGTFSTYFSVALKDSTLWIKASGTAKPEGTITVFPEAPATVIGGSGRFEGAKGDGTFLGGARFTPLPGVPAELWNEFVINVKK
jgi:hypothetical protein